ncbi:MAG: hypothetical protein JW892_14860 [Anaerolineae bacterium]|nr:hypothetical protein [Anaerolineae bacterium]
MGRTNELSDQALDCLLRSTLRDGLGRFEPSPNVWERVVKRLRGNAPVAYAQYSPMAFSHQQQLLFFSVIRLETHCHFLAGGVLRAV